MLVQWVGAHRELWQSKVAPRDAGFGDVMFNHDMKSIDIDNEDNWAEWLSHIVD